MTPCAGLLAGSINGAVIVPGDAENSLFVELVANQKMPKRGAKLTSAIVQLFEDWVDPGSAKQLIEEFRETNNPWFNFNHHGFLFLNWFPPNLQDQLKLVS
jgi:hypothetical protein